MTATITEYPTAATLPASNPFDLHGLGAATVAQAELDILSLLTLGTSNARNFGAVPDATIGDTSAGTDSTAMLQACIDDRISKGGGIVLLPPGVYRSGNLRIVNGSDLMITGPGARIQWFGTNFVPDGLGGTVQHPVGVQSDWASDAVADGVHALGTSTNVTICDLVLNGDGILGNNHKGVWNNSGIEFSGFNVLRNTITNVVNGISLNNDIQFSDPGLSVPCPNSSINCIIGWNHIENVLGTGNGQGYAIHHANGSGLPSYLKIVGNTIGYAQRHSLYQAKGSYVEIINNHIHHHRIVKADGSRIANEASQRAAINCVRSNHVSILGNQFAFCNDVCVNVGGDPVQNIASTNVMVGYNLIGDLDPLCPYAPICIGELGAPTVGTEQCSVIGNHFNLVGGKTHAITIYTGKQIRVAENHIEMVGVTAQLGCIQIRGLGETSGTALYSDQIILQDNYLYGTNDGVSGNLRAIEFHDAASIAGTRVDCIGNKVSVPGACFWFTQTQTNPNVWIGGMPITGLDMTLAKGHTVYSSQTMQVNKTAQAGAGEDLQIWGVSDDLAAYLKITNRSATDGVFAPGVTGHHAGSGNGIYILGDAVTDTGATPLLALSARINNGAVATRPLMGIYNATTLVWQLNAANILQTLSKMCPGNLAGAFQSSGIYIGAGVPNNSLGTNGDFFFQSDGTPGSRYYHRESGVWVPVTVGLLPANNLSDLVNAATARSNLGLGSAALSASSAFDAAGAAAAVAAGLGSIASHATGDFMAAGVAIPESQVTNLTTDLANLATLIYPQSQPASGKILALPYAAVQSSSSVALVNGTVYYWPLIVLKSCTVTQLAVRTGSAASSGALLRFGIYNDSSEAPGTVLVDFGAVAATAAFNNINTGAVSQALSPGRYWIAMVQQGAPSPTNVTLNTVIGTAVRGTVSLDTLTNALSGIGYCGYTQTGVTGAFATAASLTIRQNGSGGTQHPQVAVTF
jgi:hypothetical protein